MIVLRVHRRRARVQTGTILLPRGHIGLDGSVMMHVVLTRGPTSPTHSNRLMSCHGWWSALTETVLSSMARVETSAISWKYRLQSNILGVRAFRFSGITDVATIVRPYMDPLYATNAAHRGPSSDDPSSEISLDVPHRLGQQ